MTRQEFPKPVRLAAWERSGGNCEKCKVRLVPGKFAYDHVLPDGLGGTPTLDNCEVLCSSCHGAKTTQQDIPQIAKMKRQRAAHIGAKVKSRGFAPAEKQMRATKPIEKLSGMSRKRLYEKEA